ncbi:MAG: LysR family transcriptional regulator [Pseudomonadota bacterium]
MDKLHAMAAFTRVVSEGGFAAAARSLGATRSAISKAVMALEDDLGVRLLDRTTRRVSTTEAGLAYYERALQILADVAETNAQVAQLHGTPTGVLKVNAPMTFGTMYLSDIVSEFVNSHPAIKVELMLSDRFVDPIAEGLDVTLRIGTLADTSLIARRLSTTNLLVVASPGYLAAAGTPNTPQDLSAHQCLAYGHTTTLQRWRLSDDEGGTSFPITSRLCANNGEVLLKAAIAGQGLAFLPTFMVADGLRTGALVTALDAHVNRQLDIHALYAPNRYLAAKSRLFIDALVRALAVAPWEDAGEIAGHRGISTEADKSALTRPR